MTPNEQTQEQLTGKPVNTPRSLLGEHPAIPLNLPSKGILYAGDPEMAAIGGDGEIFVKPMTTEEILLFSSPELIESGNVIDAIFERCIKSNINHKKLLSSDRNYILIYLRSKSFGSKYSFPVKCQNKECNTKLKHTIDFGKLPVRELDLIHGEFINGKLKRDSVAKIKEPFVITLSSSEAKVYFRLARGIDTSEVSSEAYYESIRNDISNKTYIKDGTKKHMVISNEPLTETRTTVAKPRDSAEETIAFMSKLIYKIEGANNEVFTSKDDIIKVLKNLIAGDFSELQQKIKQADSGIDMDIVVRCPVCGYENEEEVPFGTEFFRRSL